MIKLLREDDIMVILGSVFLSAGAAMLLVLRVNEKR